MFHVRNIKVSVKVKALILNNALNKLHQKFIPTRHFGNFISFKHNGYTFVLFKKGKRRDSHVNVTQIPNFACIHRAIASLIKLIECEVLHYTVDNIIATSDLNRTLSLKEVVKQIKFKKIKYNSEIFPGVFIRFKRGTVILFHSGKLVIVGCRSIDNLRWIVNLIHVHMKKLLKTIEKEL